MTSQLIGNKCPTYTADQFKWLRGDPTDVPVPGHPTVIELWASWCGPCRQVFPHLSSMQREFADRGLDVIGISIEAAMPQVQQFVNSQGDKMAYRVAASERLGQELMAAAGVSGIPHSLMVDCAGVIKFSGHPADPAFMAAVREVTVPVQAERRELPRIPASTEELSAKPVRELKQILDERKISYTGLTEKRELVDRIRNTCQNVTYFATS